MNALQDLGAATARAVAEALDALAPGAGATTPPTVVADSPGAAFAGAQWPAVAISVRYGGGIEGEIVLVVPPRVALRLGGAEAAPAADDQAPAPAAGEELSAAGLEAAALAFEPVLEAARRAAGGVAGMVVETEPVTAIALEAAADAAHSFPHAGQVTVAAFTVDELPCLFVHLVPSAFVVSISRGGHGAPAGGLTPAGSQAPFDAALRSVQVRVWAELGRTRMPSGRVVSLPGGAVVELDREVEEPIDLYVDGMRFATGRLLVTDDGALAVRIEDVVGLPAEAAPEPVLVGAVHAPSAPEDSAAPADQREDLS